MSWKECVDEGIIAQIVPDEERSNQMLMMANLRLKSWNKKVADEFIVLKVEAYYDIIKKDYLERNELEFKNIIKRLKEEI